MTQPDSYDVFLCHSSADQATVEALARRLLDDGVKLFFADWHLAPGTPMQEALEDALEASRACAVFVGAGEFGPWQNEEMRAALAERVRNPDERRVIPVLLPGAPDPEGLDLPPFLRRLRWLDLGATEDGYERLLAAVLGQSREPPRSPGPAPRLLIANLPISGPVFVGRDDELRILDDAWDDATGVVSIVAWGGVGKTALVNHWLGALAKDGYRGARRVLGWSFYSQGSDENRVASADSFIDYALRELGDADPTAGSARDRGLRLAELVRRERTLVVLDGVEPLQQPLDSAQAGRLKDPALAAFLTSLARGFDGLCVVSTREVIADLAGFTTTAQRIDLEHLSPAAGMALLEHLGVEGAERDLKLAVEEHGGHALALTLLGNYLRKAHGGDVRHRDEVELGEADERQGGHAFRVMATYERWLGEGPELSILRLMGLFDRSALGDAVAALRAEPAIPGLTEALVALPEKDWRWALSSLRDNGLLADDDETAPGTLDAHPLVRAYFGDKLREEHPEAWRAGHERLYEYGCQAAPERPDTLAEMMPLYAGVVHGCRAGRHQDAYEEILRQRIWRQDEYYSLKKLGAFGAELTALSGFFNHPWEQPSIGLSHGIQALILNHAAIALRALGRLAEAVQPMRSGLEIRKNQEVWKSAAIIAGNLSELSLTLGDVPGAVASAEERIELADRSGDAFQRTNSRTTLADALHQAGRRAESGAAFREAETMQAERQSAYPRLYGLQGYRYCDLLLGSESEDIEARRPACEEVLRRAREFFRWRVPKDSLLTIALDHLSLGRAHLSLALASGTTDDFSAAALNLDRAVDGLRQAGTEHELPRGLLARAALRRVTSNTKGARADLVEAQEIAERGAMRLHACDVHLEWTRLCVATGEDEAAREHLEMARRLVEETGYGRREGEVALLEDSLP